MSDYFKNALNDFVSDVAYGDAIRHLAKKGMTVNQISSELLYPVNISYIQSTVWKYYINCGIIRVDNPDNNAAKQIKYVIDRDRYGRSSFRRVEDVISNASQEYIACDFGRRLYKDGEAFIKELNRLLPDDRDYILGLPWPITTVYHLKDDRMKRIFTVINRCDHDGDV